VSDSQAAKNNPGEGAEQDVHWLTQYFLDFKVLKDNPPVFWVVQGINFLDSLAYFAIISAVFLFLNENIGWDEVATGYIITVYTTSITVALFFAGFVTDSLGVKKSLIIAQTLNFITRFGILACGLIPDIPGRGWIAAILLVLSAPGMAMTGTVFQAANKRFSSKRSRSASFNIWYLLMNLGAVAGGFSLDIVRKWLELDLSWIFGVAGVAALLSAVGALLFVASSNPRLLEEDEEEEDKPKGPEKKGLELVKSVVTESAFWRFIVLMTALLGVRAVFAYMYLLMPKYWVRMIEDVAGHKTDMGLLQSINPILIVGGLILFIPIANKFNVFKMLVFGAIISSFSLLVLMMPWQWFGSDMPSAYFTMSVVMLIVLSVGEIIWSPKLTEYTAAIAPDGQEGSYLGMSMVPWFAAKLTVSALSGHMLERWVPEGIGVKIANGADISFWDRPEAMWFWLFLWAIAGPLLAIVFHKWLTKGAEDKLAPAQHFGKKKLAAVAEAEVEVAEVERDVLP